MFISAVADETKLSVDEIRMILMDVRPDWETCEMVTDAEYILIKQSAIAALPESATSITPVNPDEMPQEQQEQLINNASQVFGSPLAIALFQDIERAKSIQAVRKMAVLKIVQDADEEIAQELDKIELSKQQAFIATIQQVADAMTPTVTGTAQKMQENATAVNAQVAALLKEIEAKALGKAR